MVPPEDIYMDYIVHRRMVDPKHDTVCVVASYSYASVMAADQSLTSTDASLSVNIMVSTTIRRKAWQRRGKMTVHSKTGTTATCPTSKQGFNAPAVRTPNRRIERTLAHALAGSKTKPRRPRFTAVQIVRLGREQTQIKFLHHLATRPFAKSHSTPHFRKSSIMPTSSSRRNANRARCRMPECGKFAQTRGLCKAHGGGSRCRDPNCQKLAQSRGLCIAHGGGRRCAFGGCSKLAQSKGFCISHGGGRRCHVADCDKFAQVRGHCKSHSKLISSESWSPVSVSRLTSSNSNSFIPKTMSPNKSKLSIDFLVNPCGLASDRKEEVLPGFHTTLPHQRSLLSYLDPMTTLATTAAAMQASMTMPAHYPPLVLYR